MPGRTSSVDWFARAVALLAVVVAVAGLGLTYLNYRWQRAAYQESLEERILVRLSASRTIKKIGPFPSSLDPKGVVGLEVVNIGMRPLYIKTAQVWIGRRIFTFYERSPIKANAPMKPLEPGEAASYRLDWDFSEHALIGEWKESGTKEEDEDVRVRVETTKKIFDQQADLTWISLTALSPRAK